MLKNPRHEKAAQAFVENGGNRSEAYRAAFNAENMLDKTVHEEASRLFKRPEVSARVGELLRATVEAHGVTVEALIDELETIRREAMGPLSSSLSPAVSAVMGKAKLAGLIIDRQSVQANVVVQELPPLDPAAALVLKAQLEAERF